MDAVDDAKRAESIHLEEALSKARSQGGRAYLWKDGFPRCAGCGETVPDASVLGLRREDTCAEDDGEAAAKVAEPSQGAVQES